MERRYDHDENHEIASLQSDNRGVVVALVLVIAPLAVD